MTWLGRDQHDWLTARRAHWLELATATQRCDRSAAEAAIREWYRVAGLRVPEMVWAASPAGAQQELRNRVQPLTHGRSVIDRLWGDPHAGYGDWPIADELRWQITLALQGSALPGRYRAAGTSIWARSQHPRRAEIPFDHTLSALGDCTSALWWDAINSLGEQPDRVMAAGLAVLAEVGWVVPLRDVVVAIERPTWLEFNAQAQLQGRFAPAVRWADNIELNYWEGIELPPDFWAQTPEQAEYLEPEPRRIYFDAAGWTHGTERMAVIGWAPDPANPSQRVALLAMLELGERYPQRRHFVCVQNASLEMDGSRREFFIEVPPLNTDPIEAVASTFGLSAEQYRLLQRAC